MSRRVTSCQYEVRLIRVSEDVISSDEEFKQPIGHTFYLACSSRNKRRTYRWSDQPWEAARYNTIGEAKRRLSVGVVKHYPKGNSVGLEVFIIKVQTTEEEVWPEPDAVTALGNLATEA